MLSCEKLLLLFNLAKQVRLPHSGPCEMGVTRLGVFEEGEFQVKKFAFRGREILLCNET